MPPGGFELGAAGDFVDRFAHLFRAHVVEEDPRRAGGDGLAHLLERLRLDLDGQAFRVAVQYTERFGVIPGRQRGCGCP